MDATIIAAPQSTKNAAGQRGPEMHPIRKGPQWHFGMQLHIGVDSKTGLADPQRRRDRGHVHDEHPLRQLMHAAEREIFVVASTNRLDVRIQAPRLASKRKLLATETRSSST